jgi:hypothetical protein
MGEKKRVSGWKIIFLDITKHIKVADTTNPY